jgi:hypothetical protein
LSARLRDANAEGMRFALPSSPLVCHDKEIVMRRKSISRLLAAAMVLALPFTAHAMDRKDADLALAEAGASIEAAERADAAQYAPTELNTAHDMYASAQSAYDHRNWTDSAFAADNSKADANLASARSREHRAEATTNELERTVRSLREQMGLPGEQP